MKPRIIQTGEQPPQAGGPGNAAPPRRRRAPNLAARMAHPPTRPSDVGEQRGPAPPPEPHLPDEPEGADAQQPAEQPV
jgi:hypothetical protein